MIVGYILTGDRCRRPPCASRRLLPSAFRLPAMDQAASILAQLMAVIEDRKRNRPEKSYTTRLFAGGVPKIGEKVTEEAAEVVEAAGRTWRSRPHSYYPRGGRPGLPLVGAAWPSARSRWRKSRPSWPGDSASRAWTKKRPAARVLEARHSHPIDRGLPTLTTPISTCESAFPARAAWPKWPASCSRKPG